MSFKVSVIGQDLDEMFITGMIIEAVNKAGFYGSVTFTYSSVLEIGE